MESGRYLFVLKQGTFVCKRNNDTPYEMCLHPIKVYHMKDRNIVVTQYSPPFVDDELGEVGQGCRDAGSSWLASSAPVNDFSFLRFRTTSIKTN